ncbi:MAG: J domain-containing protein [Alphaproteobacteria bacterium]|nr:J domain-containing protein [Alphaproteobacteria bacterium]
MAAKVRKHSYVIPCSSDFREAVSALAERRGVNVGDVARSVMLVIPHEIIAACPDPGEPGPKDRETVVLKSGPSKGKPWRRKPRLQARLPKGYTTQDIRRALGVALALDMGEITVTLEDGRSPKAKERIRHLNDEIERLRAAMSVIAQEPLNNGVRNLAEALFVLGFPPGAQPSDADIKARFRMLATIHHPDAPFGDTRRMSQLNQAMTCLRNGAA